MSAHQTAIAACRQRIADAQARQKSFFFEPNQQPLRAVVPVRAMTARQRDLLERYYQQLAEMGAQLQYVANAVRLSGVDGFTDAELNCVANACAQILSRVQDRFARDDALLMQSKSLPQKLRRVA